MHPPKTVRFVCHSPIPGVLLCGLYLGGLALGLWAATHHGESYAALAIPAGTGALSLTDRWLTTLFPLLISAGGAWLHPGAVYPWAALRGALLGFSLGATVAAGGLLLAGLELLSPLLFGPAVLFYEMRRLNPGPGTPLRDFWLCAGAGLVIGAVDCWAVAPFLRTALSF